MYRTSGLGTNMWRPQRAKLSPTYKVAIMVNLWYTIGNPQAMHNPQSTCWLYSCSTSGPLHSQTIGILNMYSTVCNFLHSLQNRSQTVHTTSNRTQQVVPVQKLLSRDQFCTWRKRKLILRWFITSLGVLLVMKTHAWRWMVCCYKV